jgi:hypothetical protein
MATWAANYEADSGKFFKCVSLSVGFVEVTTGEIRGTFSQSPIEEDRRLIPQIWLDNAQEIQRGQRFCALPHTPRYALLWVTETLYLRVPLPFRPGTTQYNQFFIALAFDFSEKLVTVGQRGEQVSGNWLKLYTR